MAAGGAVSKPALQAAGSSSAAGEYLSGCAALYGALFVLCSVPENVLLQPQNRVAESEIFASLGSIFLPPPPFFSFFFGGGGFLVI